jgi:hypothetical protein
MGLYFLSGCHVPVVLLFTIAHLATVRSSEILTENSLTGRLYPERIYVQPCLKDPSTEN